MMHITDISWAQLLLIEVGALFQVAALGAFMRDAAKPDHIVRGGKEAELAHDEVTKCRLPEPREKKAPAKVVQYQRKLEGVMEDVPADVSPGNLLKTAKVTFKQVLKVSPEHRSQGPGGH